MGSVIENPTQHGHGGPPEPTATQRIAEAALGLGFCRVGFATVEPLPKDDATWQTWVDAGYHGDMTYMATHARRDDPQRILAGARSMVVVAMAYGRDVPEASPMQAAIARYAHGPDYHQVLKEKLNLLAEACQDIVGRPVLSRPCVDSAPLFERGYAAQSGVAFVAKSTMAIAPGEGSYILLGELLLDLELAPTAPIKERCGGCRACLDACPTGAFVGPRVLDARRCISYLTIERTGSIPKALRSAMGNMVFGCDICQVVCPFNASPKPRPGAAALIGHEKLSNIDLIALLELTSSGYRKLVAGTALRRVSRAMLMRNAAVALGNSGSPDAVAPLCRALKSARYSIVRGHAAWALGRLKGAHARLALEEALAEEQETFVQEEVTQALSDIEAGEGSRRLSNP